MEFSHDYLFKIPEDDKLDFKKKIKSLRSEYISKPMTLVAEVKKSYKVEIRSKLSENNISDLIFLLREKSYEAFLLEESVFNSIVLKQLTEDFDVPRAILHRLIKEEAIQSIENSEQIFNKMKNICGEFTGRISPYIYELCLSNTQSRRSRAGRVFEAIIYGIYEELQFPFETQAKIGKVNFQDQGLGKMVDSILPSIECFTSRRDKTIVGTMKTTLRERWQEVIEEINRSGLHQIYLLTVDTDISKNKAEQLKRHNVILVVLEEIKQKHAENRNIISFEDYMYKEIPEILKYWKI